MLVAGRRWAPNSSAFDTLASALGPPPTYVGRGTDVSGTTPTPGLPSGWLADDLFITSLISAGDASHADIAEPAGWVRQSSAEFFSTFYYKMNVFTRVAQGGDAAPTFAIPAGVTATVFIHAWRGINPASPFEFYSHVTGVTSGGIIPYAAMPPLGKNRTIIQHIVIPGISFGIPESSWSENFDFCPTAVSLTCTLDSKKLLTSAPASGNHGCGYPPANCHRVALALKPVGT